MTSATSSETTTSAPATVESPASILSQMEALHKQQQDLGEREKLLNDLLKQSRLSARLDALSKLPAMLGVTSVEEAMGLLQEVDPTKRTSKATNRLAGTFNPSDRAKQAWVTRRRNMKARGQTVTSKRSAKGSAHGRRISDQERAVMKSLADAGTSINQISRQFKTSRQTVKNNLQKAA